MGATAQPQLLQKPIPSRVKFLSELFGEAAPGHLVLWRRSDKRAHWVPADQLEQAGQIESDQDVYFGVALHDQREALRRSQNDDPGYVRGSSGSAIALPGLAADFDVRGPAHKSGKLPENFDDARAFIDRLPLAPTAIINSGYGFQLWWLFKELWVFDGDGEREEAQRLARRYDAMIRGMAAEQGWTFDNTSDLARVLRLPETYNAKLPELVEVRIDSWQPDRRYDPSDFEKYLVEEKAMDAEQTSSTVDTARVLAGMSEGERDSQLFGVACKLRRADVPLDVTEYLVLKAAARCTTISRARSPRQGGQRLQVSARKGFCQFCQFATWGFRRNSGASATVA